jgi:hypothetical protein
LSKPLVIRLAGLSLSLAGSNFSPIPDVYRPFITHTVTSRDRITLTVKKGSPVFKNRRLILGCETWRVYSVYSNRWLFTFHPNAKTQEPAQVVVVNKRFSRGELYHTGMQWGTVRFPNPFLHPMLEVLWVSILAGRRGILCHACGMVDNGKSLIFLGNSGDGKSTLTNLLKDHATILNDDRIVVRKQGTVFWAYGTPWHGDVDLVAARRAPLRGIFFLKHGSVNRVTPIRGAQAVTMLLARSFLPLWNRASMRQIVILGEQLAASVPCYELTFVPDDSIVKFIKKLPKDQ